MQGNYDNNPQDILRRTLQPVLDRYDFVIIDCPPSLGIVTKNGLKFSTHYVIPTIPDIVSTWGIFQIVSNVAAFSESINRLIKPLGIVATKVQGTIDLHARVMRDLRENRLFDGKEWSAIYDRVHTHEPKSLSENSKECCFHAKGRMARRDEGEYPLVDLRLRSNEARWPFAPKPSGRRVFCL
jgi:cellulose biosynthesis protein BcsQ